jgi:hemerythrin-like domain-containing protein
MNAVRLLKDDHKKVKGLFREYEGAGERAYKTKLGIAEQVFTELEVHTKIEEEIFYPAVRAKGGELKDVVSESLEEHHVVDVLMAELKALDPEDERYDAKFKVLTENVEHHIEEEETEMLPDAEKKLGDADMERLGEQMAARTQQLLKEGRAPR